MSFNMAATDLNLTQSAVSHQIRRLEEQLGLPLFIPHNRELVLTREAQDYLPFVRSAFEEQRPATEKLRRADRDGLLTVSTTASLATKWLVSWVAAYAALPLTPCGGSGLRSRNTSCTPGRW
jgi:LysR family glycine cleavage system transcriptional activator